ncbi:DUF7555 family protein [Natrononativus amylolyticus]|uniref:DUF7555 family protein n=1 Tax=Natrononativus amylolyticus TaxID=2963434 RepID=UPI0020CD946A|nr:hypothetical protein [Natrononativus amylolyticus]
MSETPNRWFVMGLDASVYTIAITLIGIGLAVVLSIPFGAHPEVVKAWLFVLAWLLIGYATVLLWPRTPKKWGSKRTEKRIELDRRSGPNLQRRLNRLPPLKWYDDDSVRLPTGVKLYIASVWLLLVSFLMERVLGIGV